jgi:hypothetical protein
MKGYAMMGPYLTKGDAPPPCHILESMLFFWLRAVMIIAAHAVLGCVHLLSTLCLKREKGFDILRFLSPCQYAPCPIRSVM